VYTRGMAMSIVVAEMLVPLSHAATPFEHGTDGRMVHPEDKKPGALVYDASRQTQPNPCAETHRTSVSAQLKKPCIAAKRWIPLDLVQNTAEYLGCVPSLLSFRGVSAGWQGAVSDAVGFLNGRRWTRLVRDGPLWSSLCLDDADVVVRCALLCLGPRLETFEWQYVTSGFDLPLCLLGENNTVLTTLSLTWPAFHYGERPTDVSCLRNCSALKILCLSHISVTDASIRGLKAVPTLEIVSLWGCHRTTDVSCLQKCRALKTLDLLDTDVTDAGIRGLELIPTLEVLIFSGCNRITDVSCLRSCPALKKLDLTITGVGDAGIRGLELIPTLEDLKLSDCGRILDVSCLRSCPALKKLDLSSTRVTDAGIRGLELIPTLEDFKLSDCSRILDVSYLRSCPALKKLHLSLTSVTDAGIRGLELIPTLEDLDLTGCKYVHDLSALRNRPLLRLIGP
jgi:hypothetical protein